jgi:hypothetical protein
MPGFFKLDGCYRAQDGIPGLLDAQDLSSPIMLGIPGNSLSSTVTGTTARMVYLYRWHAYETETLHKTRN